MIDNSVLAFYKNFQETMFDREVLIAPHDSEHTASVSVSDKQEESIAVSCSMEPTELFASAGGTAVASAVSAPPSNLYASLMSGRSESTSGSVGNDETDLNGARQSYSPSAVSG